MDLYGIIRKEKFCFQYSSESSHLQISVISKRPFHRSIQDICNNLKFILLFCSVNLKFNFIQLTFVDPCIIVQFVQRNPTRCNSVSKFIIPYLYEAQHVTSDTPLIIGSLKLHWQPLVCISGRLLEVWLLDAVRHSVGRVVAGSCQAGYTLPDSVQQPHVQQTSTYAKPETASAVLGS